MAAGAASYAALLDGQCQDPTASGFPFQVSRCLASTGRRWSLGPCDRPMGCSRARRGCWSAELTPPVSKGFQPLGSAAGCYLLTPPPPPSFPFQTNRSRLCLLWPAAPAAGILEPDDILMRFDGVEVANDGTVPFRTGERIAFG